LEEKGIMVLDDRVQHIAAPGALLFDKADPPYKIVVGGNRANPEFNFRGAVSCVQFYPKALTESAIQSKKDCEAGAGVHRSKTPCPKDYRYYDGSCYKEWQCVIHIVQLQTIHYKLSTHNSSNNAHAVFVRDLDL
jgi:hypothetical protein